MQMCSIACLPLSSVEGPATHVRELHEALARDRIAVTLWLPDLGKPPRTEIRGITVRLVRVLDLPVLRFVMFDVFLFVRLFFRFLRSRPDVLYMRQSYSTLLPGVLARLFRLRFVVEVNGFFEWDLRARGVGFVRRFMSRLAERISYGAASSVICVADGIKQQLDMTYGTAGKTTVIRNGVNTDAFEVRSRDACRAELALDRGKLIVGYVGCFTPWDGIGSLVAVAPRLLERLPNLEFLLVGAGQEYENVRAAVQRSGLDEHFSFTGFVERNELNRYISSFDVAVAPYSPGRNKMGVSSLKCLEYFACGIPAVVGGVPEMDYVEASGGGRLFPPGDEDKFASILIHLLSADAERAAMGANARRHVESECTWTTVAQRTRELLIADSVCHN